MIPFAMPPPRYIETRTARLADAWDLLQGPTDWEIAERRPGGRLVLGRPPIRRRSRGGGSATILRGAAAQEDTTGVRLQLPAKSAGATWVATEQEALEEFDKTMTALAAQTAGEERLLRVELVIAGQIADHRLVAVGEITQDPDVLDALSLTYLGVVLSVALALALGISGLSTVARIGVGVGTFLSLALLLRAGPFKRRVVRFARWALPGAHDVHR